MGKISKLKGNSFYETVFEDLYCYTTFTANEWVVDIAHRQLIFEFLEEISNTYQISKKLNEK